MNYRIKTAVVRDICLKASIEIMDAKEQFIKDAESLTLWKLFKVAFTKNEQAITLDRELTFCTKHLKATGMCEGTYCILSLDEMVKLHDLHLKYVMDYKI